MARISNNVIEETKCNFIKIEKQVKTSLLIQNTPRASRGFSLSAWILVVVIPVGGAFYTRLGMTSDVNDFVYARSHAGEKPPSQGRCKISFCEWQGTPRKSFPWNSWLGCASRFSSSSKCPDPISDRKNVIFHTRFQIFLTKIHTHFQTRHRQKSCHHCLDI